MGNGWCVGLREKNQKAADRLIFALDVGTEEEAKALVKELKSTINFFKIGLQLFIATGLNVVEWLIDQNLNVFLDMKMYDVGATIRSSVAEVSRLGVKFLTIHGDGLTAEAAREGKGDTDLKILFLTLLTSLNEEDLSDLYFVGEPHGRFEGLEDYVKWRSEMAMRHGCDGLITSGQNVPLLRQTLEEYDPILVCPGIRPKGDLTNDHKRATTPYEAILKGADYLVVGRPIRNAEDRVAKAEKVIEEIDSALQDRG